MIRFLLIALVLTLSACKVQRTVQREPYVVPLPGAKAPVPQWETDIRTAIHHKLAQRYAPSALPHSAQSSQLARQQP